MNYARKALKGAAFLFITTIFAQFFGYLVRMILARNLTPTEFGLFYSVFTLFMFISIFTDFGFGAALTKYIAEFKAKNLFASLRKSFFYVLFIKLGLSLLIGLLLFLFSGVFAAHYFKSSAALFIIQIFAVILIINSFNSLFISVFRGFQRMFLAGLVNFLHKFSFFIFVVFFLFLGFPKNANLPAFAFFLSTIGPLLILGWFLIPLLNFKIKIHELAPEVLFKKLSSFAFPSMLTGISGIVIGYIDIIILTAFVSLAEVGVYNAVLPTALIVAKLGSGLNTAMFPLVSEINAKNEHHRLRKGIKKLHNYGFFGILPFGLILLAFPVEILKILFGVNYVSGAFPLQILAIGIVFLVIGKINNSILSGLGHPKEVLKVTVGAAILNTVLNLLLIPFIGLIGAAFTTTISYLFIFTTNSIKISKIINMKIIWKDWLKIIFAGLIFLAMIYSIKTILPFHIYINGAIGIIFGGITYIFLGYKLKVFNFKEVLAPILSKVKK